MNKDQALKLALEALQRNDYLGYQKNLEVIAAIKDALVEKQEPVAWIGLTEADRDDVLDTCWDNIGIAIASTERRLREKNHG